MTRIERWGSRICRRPWTSFVPAYRARYALSGAAQLELARRDLASMLQYAFRFVPRHGMCMRQVGVDPWRDDPEVVLAAMPLDVAARCA